MAKLTVQEEFQSAVRTAAREAEPTQTSRAVAAKFAEDFPDLIQPFSEEWIIEKLSGLIAGFRLKARREQDVEAEKKLDKLSKKG